MNIYPLTIISDPFEGKYSQGKFLAFNEYANKIPSVFSYDDFALHFVFWDNYEESQDGLIGIGDTFDDAVRDLVIKLQKKAVEETKQAAANQKISPLQYTSVSKELDELKKLL